MREKVWCLTEAGPLGEYLYKYNLVATCRFCRVKVESVCHLLTGCEYLNLKHIPAFNTKSVENKIAHLFKELRISQI